MGRILLKSPIIASLYHPIAIEERYSSRIVGSMYWLFSLILFVPKREDGGGRISFDRPSEVSVVSTKVTLEAKGGWVNETYKTYKHPAEVEYSNPPHLKSPGGYYTWQTFF